MCVCTYKRPVYLNNLLNSLISLSTDNTFSYSIVIVDNDYELSGKDVVNNFTGISNIMIEYYTEPERNISLARNKAVLKSNGNILAFIDDDEIATKNWLLLLYKTYKAHNISGVLGPVKPFFDKTPPKWIIKSQICERESFVTGSVLNSSKYTRTGNALLSKNIFDQYENYFNPKLGLTGGEDTYFFKNLIEKGHIFIWCDEAIVYELIPSSRLSRAYFIKRSLLRGKVNSQYTSAYSINTLKSIVAIFIYTISFPFLALAGHHIFMKYFLRACDHLGKILSFIGINLVKEKEV